jgi:hypothetical protein
MKYPESPNIYWEKWVDAYSENMENISETDLDLDDDELDNFDEEELQPFAKPVQTILTPFGILPLTEQTLASTHFKFWVGHSNFKLLDSYYESIEMCAGVESVDILTPYRFRIAIGKLFKDRDVMGGVRDTLVGLVE